MAYSNGILTGGLGGDSSTLILGQFNLGFVTVTIEPEPPIIVPPPVTGGAGGDYADTPQRYKVSFTIRHKKHTWQKEYTVNKSNGLILIRITKVINKVIDNVKIAIKGIKKKLGSIDISLWKR